MLGVLHTMVSKALFWHIVVPDQDCGERKGESVDDRWVAGGRQSVEPLYVPL
jgi:hypothetical protein